MLQIGSGWKSLRDAGKLTSPPLAISGAKSVESGSIPSDTVEARSSSDQALILKGGVSKSAAAAEPRPSSPTALRSLMNLPHKVVGALCLGAVGLAAYIGMGDAPPAAPPKNDLEVVQFLNKTGKLEACHGESFYSVSSFIFHEAEHRTVCRNLSPEEALKKLASPGELKTSNEFITTGGTSVGDLTAAQNLLSLRTGHKEIYGPGVIDVIDSYRTNPQSHEFQMPNSRIQSEPGFRYALIHSTFEIAEGLKNGKPQTFFVPTVGTFDLHSVDDLKKADALAGPDRFHLKLAPEKRAALVQLQNIDRDFNPVQAWSRLDNGEPVTIQQKRYPRAEKVGEAHNWDELQQLNATFSAQKLSDQFRAPAEVNRQILGEGLRDLSSVAARSRKLTTLLTNNLQKMPDSLKSEQVEGDKVVSKLVPNEQKRQQLEVLAKFQESLAHFDEQSDKVKASFEKQQAAPTGRPRVSDLREPGKVDGYDVTRLFFEARLETLPGAPFKDILQEVRKVDRNLHEVFLDVQYPPAPQAR